MSDKLSNCPFCESADIEYRAMALHWVRCNSCGAEGPGKTNKRAAVAAWNRRPSPASAIVEAIASQWDGCMFEGIGHDINIGESIRDAYRLLNADCAAPEQP
ncbi:Lar family restriction alleviation protein [Burkholderia glumae]|uniref:Lar family restriction alleviation protein n=1 Tax=Burkholderia glumae TaxID=337 RepID=UPI003B9B2D25